MLGDTDNPTEAGIFQEIQRKKKKKADQRALNKEHIHEKFCRIYWKIKNLLMLQNLTVLWKRGIYLIMIYYFMFEFNI